MSELKFHPTYRDGSGFPLILLLDLEEECPVCMRGSLHVLRHDRPNYTVHCDRCDHIEYRDVAHPAMWARLQEVQSTHAAALKSVGR